MVLPEITPKKLLAKCRKKRILLLAHDNADLDAVCSALIFKEFLKKNKISSMMGIPSHINDRAQHLCFAQKVSFQVNPNLKDFDLVLLFDFNSPEQLGRLRKSFEELLRQKCFGAMAFDHHVAERDSLVKGKNAVLDDDCVSTTELLYNLLDEVKPGRVLRVLAKCSLPGQLSKLNSVPQNQRFCSDKYFTKQMHFLNCLGIIEDTGHFLVGDSKAFSSFSDSLKKSGKKYSDVLEFSKIQILSDERIAFLKAAQRAEIQQIRDAIVVTSFVSFYQGAAASKLLDFGAHISLVAGQEKDGLTVLSARAESEFKESRKFNLMKGLMIPLKSEIGGDVGGHSGAAQWKGKAAPEKVLQTALELLKKKL